MGDEGEVAEGHPSTPHLCNIASCSSNTARKRLGKLTPRATSAPMFTSFDHCYACKKHVSKKSITLASSSSAIMEHCRCCGYTYCEDCSSHSAQVPYLQYLDEGEVRVCDQCFAYLDKYKEGSDESLVVRWNDDTEGKVLLRRADFLGDKIPSAPMWSLDKECFRCKREFHILLEGRHHCRNCGRSFCDPCSPHEWRLKTVQHQDKGCERVCGTCFELLGGRALSALPRAVSPMMASCFKLGQQQQL